MHRQLIFLSLRHSFACSSLIHSFIHSFGNLYSFIRWFIRAACRKANYEIRKSRCDNYQERINEAVGDPKETWKIAKELLHRKKPSAANNTSNTKDRCNIIAAFFNDKLEKIKRTILDRLESLCHIDIHFHLPSTPQFLSELAPVTAEEVFKIILNLKPKTSPLDYLPTKILKSCPGLFAPLIAHLANLSFQSGRFPTKFKSAQVTPLLKKDGLDPSDLLNLRPISNLNTLSKILEKLALARLSPHITSSPNFNPFQSGFRPGHSTETTLLKVTNDILCNADDGSATFLLSLDISAAFDAMDHKLLAARAQDVFGVTGNALNWLTSYLEGRHFFIALGSAKSDTLSSTTGVPQGSVLGPFLFSMFISPVSFLIQSFGIQHHQYADDTQLYTSLASSGNQSRDNITHCAEAVNRWFLENGLLLNPSKTEATVFGTRSQIAKHQDIQPTFSNTAINLSSTVKILGVKLDSTLSMDSQTAEIVRSANFHIRALRHIRPFLTKELANTIACGIVNSRLDYCNSLLYGTSSKNLTSLQRIQNNLARVVCNSSYRTSSKPLLKSLHWLPVKERIVYKIAIITYNCVTTKTPSYLSDLLQIHMPSRNMRSSGNRTLVLHRCRTTTASRSFVSAAPRIWNNLPTDTRNSTALAVFKKHLKTELFTQAHLG